MMRLGQERQEQISYQDNRHDEIGTGKTRDRYDTRTTDMMRLGQERQGTDMIPGQQT